MTWFYVGKMEGELEFLYAASDDAWERDSRLMAMIYNLSQIVANMMSGQPKFKDPDDFNDSLKAPEGSPEAIADDYPWAGVEEASGNEAIP